MTVFRESSLIISHDTYSSIPPGILCYSAVYLIAEPFNLSLLALLAVHTGGKTLRNHIFGPVEFTTYPRKRNKLRLTIGGLDMIVLGSYRIRVVVVSVLCIGSNPSCYFGPWENIETDNYAYAHRLCKLAFTKPGYRVNLLAGHLANQEVYPPAHPPLWCWHCCATSDLRYDYYSSRKEISRNIKKGKEGNNWEEKEKQIIQYQVHSLVFHTSEAHIILHTW